MKSEFVRVGADLVGRHGIVELLEYVFRTRSPARRLDTYEGWRFISRLEQVIGGDACRKVFDNELRVLSTRLNKCKLRFPGK
jgi:hypothetical protein